MKEGNSILTREEQDVLLSAAAHPNGQHLSNIEIAQRLGISVSKVKILIHQACIKLGAHNRIEAILLAIFQGELRIDQIYTHDELAEILSTLCPQVFKKITHLVHDDLDNEQLQWNYEQISNTNRKRDTILTKREQDVLALVGRGLTNKEIADTLYMCPSTVRTFLYRACSKLGACNRLDAIVLALKRGEIVISDILSFNELLENLAPLGSDSLEQIGELRIQKLAREPVTAGI